MSVRSAGHNNYGNSRSTRVEDYYSDEEEEHPRNTPISSYSSNSPRHSPKHFHAYNNKRNSMVNRNSGLRNSVRYFHPEDEIHDQSRYGYSEEDEEEDLRRAIHDFGLEDHMYNNRIPLPPPRRRSSFEYEMDNRMMYSPHHSPGYFLPPPPPPSARFEDDMHFQQFMGGDSRYGPPPMHHPPPPPHWMPPHPSQEFGPPPPPPQNDMIMYSPQHQAMDLPFVRRSASSRSYNRRNRPNHRSIRRNPEALFLSRDDTEEPVGEHDVNYHRFRQPPPHPSQLRPSLSRQNSVGSNSSRKSNSNPHPQFRMKRANSFSAPGSGYPPPPPHFFMQPPPPPHDFYGPRIRSEPNSPRLSAEESSSSGEEDSMDEYYGRPNVRRNSMPAAGGRGNIRPLGRSMSFQGMPPPPPPMGLPPQQQAGGPLPPQIIMHPPPMPHPNVLDNTLRRNASMFNLPTNAAGGNPGGGDFFVDPVNPQQPQQSQVQPQPQEHTNGSTTPASTNEIPPALPMWMAMPPPPPPPAMGAFPNSPGANVGNPFNQQQQQQQQQQAAAAAAAQMMMANSGPMGMFNNPMMPPQQPLWNFMNPQDLFFGNEMPLPFMNSSDPNVIVNAMGAPVPPPPQQGPKPQGSPNVGGETGGEGPADKDQMRGNRPEEGPGGPGGMMPPPNEMMMPPPPPQQEPMLRRGLSMLGGLFGSGGGGRKGGPSYFGGPPPPPHFGGDDFGPRGGGGFGNFHPPIQGYQSKKEAKLAQQYQKLGLIWCWRRVDSEDNRFESFNISNQKLIKRKADKPESMNGGGIMLGKEKKLPGEIMIDINRGCGCAMNIVNGQQQFTRIEIKQEPFEGSSIVFNGSGSGGGWM